MTTPRQLRGGNQLSLSSPELLHPCAPALNENDQHDNEQNAGHYTDNRRVIHFNSPFSQWLNSDLNDCIMMMAAGPSTTTNNAGKINSTRGKRSLIDSFAAFSSISCTRLVRSVSE